jgi:alcohol dehydrogenase/L-iditol 2-dehydrogenase
MAALSGANPLVVAGLRGDAMRLEAARALGATRAVNVEDEDLEAIVRGVRPLGADVVCDASGAARPLEAALKIVRPDGQVTKVGWSPPGVPIDTNPIVQKNARLQGSFSHTYVMWERVIHLLAEGLTRPEVVIGMRTGLDGWRDAFGAMEEGRVIKSVLVPA